MGICASCLGLDRHSTPNVEERNPLLEDTGTQYGISGPRGIQRREEEDRIMEREYMEQIAAEAMENMVDVVHPDRSRLNRLSDSYITNHVGGAEVDGKNESEWPPQHLMEDEMDIHTTEDLKQGDR